MIRSSEGLGGKWGEWWTDWYNSVDGYSVFKHIDAVTRSWSCWLFSFVIIPCQGKGCSGPAILREEEYHLHIVHPWKQSLFFAGTCEVSVKRLSKNGNEANRVEPRHATPLFGAQSHCIWNNFDRIKVSDLPSTPKKSKNILGLITGQFEISFLVSSKALQKRIQCHVQTRDRSISGAYFPESRSLPHAKVFIDAPNLRLWDLWLSIGFSIWAAIHFVHGPSKQIRFFDWLNQI